MRITSEQKNELISIIFEYNIDVEIFKIFSNDDQLNIKYLFNYFEFDIKKISATTYLTTVKHVSNLQSHEYDTRWESVRSLFRQWVITIKTEFLSDLDSGKTAHNGNFPKDIVRYSKNFVKIYSQSMNAEKFNLTEICGLGYRKSFEFLIKDYLMKKNPKEEHAKIKSMLISQCIDKYINDDQIKLLSHRVLWLGNDHAHYTIKWKDKTLKDLKILIQLTIKWIQIRDELDKVEKSMPFGKK